MSLHSYKGRLFRIGESFGERPHAARMHQYLN